MYKLTQQTFEVTEMLNPIPKPLLQVNFSYTSLMIILPPHTHTHARTHTRTLAHLLQMQATLFRGVKGIRGLGKKLKKGGKKDPDSISIGYPKVDFDRASVEVAPAENESDDETESLYDEV